MKVEYAAGAGSADTSCCVSELADLQSVFNHHVTSDLDLHHHQQPQEHQAMSSMLRYPGSGVSSPFSPSATIRSLIANSGLYSALDLDKVLATPTFTFASPPLPELKSRDTVFDFSLPSIAAILGSSCANGNGTSDNDNNNNNSRRKVGVESFSRKPPEAGSEYAVLGNAMASNYMTVTNTNQSTIDYNVSSNVSNGNDILYSSHITRHHNMVSLPMYAQYARNSIHYPDEFNYYISDYGMEYINRDIIANYPQLGSRSNVQPGQGHAGEELLMSSHHAHNIATTDIVGLSMASTIAAPHDSMDLTLWSAEHMDHCHSIAGLYG